MEIEVSFPGGKRVDAKIGEFVIKTDQSVSDGGQGSAPEPFALFLASLGTCAGLYVIAFCRARSIPLDGIRMIERSENDPETGRLVHVELEIQVPENFPAHYREPLARAALACKVKKTLFDPPEVNVVTSTGTHLLAAV